MADQRPDDHRSLGGLTPEQGCPECGHDHLFLHCEFCPCGLHVRNGIDL